MYLPYHILQVLMFTVYHLSNLNGIPPLPIKYTLSSWIQWINIYEIINNRREVHFGLVSRAVRDFYLKSAVCCYIDFLFQFVTKKEQN